MENTKMDKQSTNGRNKRKYKLNKKRMVSNLTLLALNLVCGALLAWVLISWANVVGTNLDVDKTTATWNLFSILFK